jgi:hypothetical protein
MHEISAALDAVNIPGDFHRAAAIVYERLATLKDAEGLALSDVISKAG